MNELTINPNRIDLDEAYLQMAEVWAKRSKANRLQVGAIIVKNRQIVSDGYNGMPAGVEDDVCEYWSYPMGLDLKPSYPDGPEKVLTTKLQVLHAESNAITKAAKNGGQGLEGATIYTTYSPCPDCAKLIKQAGISRVIYRHKYRLLDGLNMLNELGVPVTQLKG